MSLRRFAEAQKRGKQDARQYFLTVRAVGNVMVAGKIGAAMTAFYAGLSSLLTLLPTHYLSTEVEGDQIWTRSPLVFQEVCQPIHELRIVDTVCDVRGCP